MSSKDTNTENTLAELLQALEELSTKKALPLREKALVLKAMEKLKGEHYE